MTIRLAQPLLVQLVNFLKTQVDLDGKTKSGGVLYGTLSSGQLTIERFKAFKDSDEERAFTECLASAKNDPDFSALKLVGWFAVRDQDSRGLTPANVEFHNRRFRRVSDLALILRLDRHSSVRTDFYSKSPYAAFSQRHHRYGALRLSLNEAPTDPVDIKMKPSAQRAALPVVLARMPGVGFQPGTARIAYTTGPVLIRATKRVRSKAQLPDLVRSLTGAQRMTISAAAIFVLTGGLTFASIFLHTPAKQELPDYLPAATGFSLKIQPQGDGLLLTWNGNLAGAYKARGIMLIDDAARHREVPLEPDEIANGALLYRPASSNVVFRLRLSNDRGKTLTDSLRTVNASHLDSSTPTTSLAAEKQPAAADRVTLKESRARARRNTVTSKHAGASPKIGPASSESSVTPFLSRPSGRPAPLLPSRWNKTPIEIASLTPPAALDEARRPSVSIAPDASLKVELIPPPAALGPEVTAPQFYAPPILSSLLSAPDTGSAAIAKTDAANHPAKATTPRYEIAKLETKVMPDPMMLAYSVQTAVILKLQIRINDKGRVTDGRVVERSAGVNAEIEEASIAAVKQWTFEPAKSYGSPVESDYIVVLHFSPAPVAAR